MAFRVGEYGRLCHSNPQSVDALNGSFLAERKQYGMKSLPDEVAVRRDALLNVISSYGSCAVAFSGGVDSAVVAKAAQLALGDAAVLVTGNGQALATGELEEARHVADLIGVRHVIVDTDELSRPQYVANGPDRCYHCKTELYGRVSDLAARLGVHVLVNGANADDLRDYRPGQRAAAEHEIRSPLAECGINKREVRQLAAAWDLPVAEKPASPCLASRLAYGVEVTPERLAMVDRAEQIIRSLGFRELRVRYHPGDLARIEIPASQVAELCEPDVREFLVSELRGLGFKFVSVDLAGFQSGGLNQLIDPSELRKWT